MINITMSKADCAPAIRRFTDASSRNFSERIIEMKIPNGLREEIRRICQKIIQMIVLLSKAIEDRDQVLPVTRARSNRVSAFFHATDYIIGGLGGPLNIEDVAAHAAVSPRTLEYAFRDCLGIRPVEYIRMRRLAEARRLLLGVKPEQTRVSDIAQACGFTHQGFFARDYRLQFLELPSQTLKKRDVLGSE
jgi:transcriptional regulator GlxA family with amidase domain